MPRPEPPPTPASSTEIKGQDGSNFPPLQMSFELPPPAVTSAESRPSSSSTKQSSSAATSTSSYRPASPVSPALPASEVVKIRRRSSVAQKPAAPKDSSFALPPPPTRSRKIIQMKPKEQHEEQLDTPADGPKTAAGKAPPKKKQPSATSVAGRKIARKTAHSLIERRRRSKMNEEFGVLKDMIPACTGEMHKLAILQASIDYVRYLEDCVAKLKAENNRTNSTPTSEQFILPPPAVRGQYQSAQEYAAYEDEDIEMDGSETHSPPSTAHTSRSQRPSESPALLPRDSHNRHSSYSSASADRRHYSFSASSTTSPSLGPTAYDYARNPGSTLTSPALLPQRDLDQEATAALLMLNTDRRGTHANAGRGMSVQDLLSA